jgi:hypothetical protein
VNGANSGQSALYRRVCAPVRKLGLVVGPVLALLLAFGPRSVCSQSSVRPTITVAPAVSGEAESQAAFSIAVGPAEAVPPQSFIRLRGLPPMAALSEGYSIAPGAWAVPLAALPKLKIMLPAGVSGRSEIVIRLVALNGMVLAEAKSVLAVVAIRQQTQRKVPAPVSDAAMLRAGASIQSSPEAKEQRGPAPPVAAGQPMIPPDRERAQRLMKKGDQELEEGNLSAARLFYEYAADAGLAQAAMALAATFDPSELAKLKVRGMAPDAKEARRWYERAGQLGAGEAEQRITRLGAQ